MQTPITIHFAQKKPGPRRKANQGVGDQQQNDLANGRPKRRSAAVVSYADEDSDGEISKRRKTSSTQSHEDSDVESGKKGKAAKKQKKEKPPVDLDKPSSRFGGLTEAEVLQRGLPDYLRHGLDIVFIGINPGLCAAYTGRYYDGPGNHFWNAMHLSGFLPRPMAPEDDHLLLDLGIGFTNVVARTTRGLADLSRAEIAEGAKLLRQKLAEFRPKIAVFNGKAIYEVYSGQKKFMFGKQNDKMEGTDTWVWVMPSSSARCAQLPRAVDKVPFFSALRRFRDNITGRSDEPLEEHEVVFANVVLKNFPRKVKQEQEEHDDENEEHARG